MKLSNAVEAVAARPLFRGARFGIAIFPLGEDRAVYALNEGELFAAASVTKIPTCVTALERLGADYRFRTPVLRYGEIDGEGILHGDLVLVASGDPNLSNRVSADTLSFFDVDHAMGNHLAARPVAGDRLTVLRALAEQVRNSGIRRIDGHIVVDVSLFTGAGREGGTGVSVSPVSVNDNMVDVRVIPSEKIGEPPALEFHPVASCFTYDNRAKTAKPGSQPALRFVDDEEPRDPAIVTITGEVPQGPAFWTRYCVPSPRRYAEALFRQALRESGVDVTRDETNDVSRTTTGVEVASHTSPPLSQAVKVVLKVSQNMHAELLMRACGGGERSAGLRVEREVLEGAGIDVSAIAQGDAAGGAGCFTPEVMCQILQFAARQPYAAVFREALPVMGVDGTLFDIQRESSAVGSVRAKTGTSGYPDDLNSGGFLSAKSLAGYLDAQSGRSYVFTVFANNIHCAAGPEGHHEIGESLGEIAVAARALL